MKTSGLTSAFFRRILLRGWACVGAWLIAVTAAQSATVSNSNTFNFNHGGSISTATLSILTLYSNTEVYTSGSISLQRFDPTLGVLTGVNVTVVTTTNTMTIQKALSFNATLLGSATASRTLAYAITAGTATGSNSSNATTTAGTLLTLLGTANAPIGGASMNQSSAFSSASDLAQFTGAGTFTVDLTATNLFSITTALSLFNAGFTGTGNYSGTVTVVYTYTPFTVSGYVYGDTNRNGFKDGSEAGTNLTIYAKLVSTSTPTGPASQAVAVNSSTGAYSISGMAVGNYTVVLSTNNTLSDVTAMSVPTGWSATEQPSRTRNVTVGYTDVPNQNFGFAPFSSIAGQVFRDTGTGGGSANDGVRNGSETGLGGVTVSVLNASNTVLDTTQTAADGTYALYLPSSVTTGTVLRVIETNPSNLSSTGGSAGTTGGTYAIATDIVTFTHTVSLSYTGVNFADVPVSQLIADGQQSTVPGTTVYYAHQFIAGTGGQVQFSLTPTRTPATAGWVETLYLDTNANGLVDPTEQVISGTTTVTEGQVLNLVVKVFAPAAAPNGARDSSVLTANFSLTGSSPLQSVSLTRTDVTIISGSTTAGLKLVKTVDKAQAKPGDTITYTITFTNQAAGPLGSVVVSDETPAYTSFASASTGSLPTGFTLNTLTKPTAGTKGALRWTFSGNLLSAGTGTVSFAVTVDQ